MHNIIREHFQPDPIHLGSLRLIERVNYCYLLCWSQMCTFSSDRNPPEETLTTHTGRTHLSSYCLCLLRSALPPAASAWQQQVQAHLSGCSRHGVLPSAPVLLLILWPCPQLCCHGEWPPFVQDELHPHLQPLLPLRQHWEGTSVCLQVCYRNKGNCCNWFHTSHCWVDIIIN